jgi:hypothetical protein
MNNIVVRLLMLGTLQIIMQSCFSEREKYLGANRKMKKMNIAVAASLFLLPTITTANDFTTVARVQYVMDCMELNQGKMNSYESIHKCSCVVDEIAKSFTQREFEDANAGFRFQNLPGDRGATFRDDKGVQSGIKLFKKVHSDAYEECRIRR